MIKFRCPHCDQKLGVPDEYAGRRVRCSKCNQSFTVPTLSAMPSANAVAQVSAAGGKQQPSSATVSKTVSEKGAAGQAVRLKTRAPASSEALDELELEEQTAVQELVPGQDRREEAIRMARQQRAKEVKDAVKGGAPKAGTKIASGKKHTFSFSLNEIVPEALRMPVGLGLSLICMGALIGGWVIAAKATTCALCFVALFVPLAAAFGMKLVSVNGGFLLGAAAALLGGLGIAGGKAAIAQYVVIPFQQDYVKQEVLTDMPKLLADERYQLADGESVKPVIRDGDFMTCIALFSLVDEGKADAVKARKWAFDILRASNKTNVYAMVLTALNSAPEVPKLPEMTEEDQPMFDMAWQRMSEWEEQETDYSFARKYFPALNCVASQCETARLLEKPDTAFKFAILSTLGLFDVVWILLGMGLAYISLCLD